MYILIPLSQDFATNLKFEGDKCKSTNCKSCKWYPPEIVQCTYAITHEDLEKIREFIRSKMRNVSFTELLKLVL